METYPPGETTNCEECGKPIAASLPGSALCCRCRYGQMQDTAEPRHEPDAYEMMRRNDARFLSRPAPDFLVCCHQCGLEAHRCNCNDQ